MEDGAQVRNSASKWDFNLELSTGRVQHCRRFLNNSDSERQIANEENFGPGVELETNEFYLFNTSNIISTGVR